MSTCLLYSIDYEHAVISEHRPGSVCQGKVVKSMRDDIDMSVTVWWRGPRGNLRRAVLVSSDWMIDDRDGQIVLQRAANPQPSHHGHATSNVTSYTIVLAP
ncbi:MAG: hypothetical protein JW384_03336 [Nitrosomonadaceae bacterium]|nr:hypothetical protein [Nitrosomonadaceae bacterium]